MPINFNDKQVKKCNFNDYIVKKINFNDAEVWKSSITVTNLLSASVSNGSWWQDVGEDTWSTAINYFNTVPGHRYYVRMAWSGRADGGGEAYPGGDFWANVRFNGTTVVSVSGINLSPSKVGHAVIKATKSSTLADVESHRYHSGYGQSYGTVYMVVDITELEKEFGTMTANQVWGKLGGAIFYGDTEVPV